jgi:hypothetical protein
MTTKTEALKQALNTKNENVKRGHLEAGACFVTYEGAAGDLNALSMYVNRLENAIRAAIAQPERQWVALSKKQIKKLGDTPTLYSDYEAGRSSFEYLCPYKFAQAIDAKLKELNA